jgi:hypothetical protein
MIVVYISKRNGRINKRGKKKAKDGLSSTSRRKMARRSEELRKTFGNRLKTKRT